MTLLMKSLDVTCAQNYDKWTYFGRLENCAVYYNSIDMRMDQLSKIYRITT